MVTEAIDGRNATPIIEQLNKYGGWPLLGDAAGGNWDQQKYDFETLAGRLRGELGIDGIFQTSIGRDDKDKKKYSLYVSRFLKKKKKTRTNEQTNKKQLKIGIKLCINTFSRF